MPARPWGSSPSTPSGPPCAGTAPPDPRSRETPRLTVKLRLKVTLCNTMNLRVLLVMGKTDLEASTATPDYPGTLDGRVRGGGRLGAPGCGRARGGRAGHRQAGAAGPGTRGAVCRLDGSGGGGGRAGRGGRHPSRAPPAEPPPLVRRHPP